MLRQLSFCIETCPKLYQSFILPARLYHLLSPEKCTRVHWHLPYRWQLLGRDGLTWSDLPNMEEIERAYCDPRHDNSSADQPSLGTKFQNLLLLKRWRSQEVVQLCHLCDKVFVNVLICLQLRSHQPSISWLHDHDLWIISGSPSVHGLFHLEAPALYSDDRVALVLEGWPWPMAGVWKGLLKVCVWPWLLTMILPHITEQRHFSPSWELVFLFFHVGSCWHAGLRHLHHAGGAVSGRQR